MRKQFSVVLLLSGLLSTGPAPAQTAGQQTPRPAGQTPPARQAQAERPAASADLAEYGVRIEPEPRLTVMMAALEAAGLELTPAGAQVSPLRARVRADLAGLDADLRARMQTFFKRNRLAEPATPAEQAARYVSLAYVLGPPPAFDAPARTDDLPSGVLEVLDFAPLLREFYRSSGIDGRLPEYVAASREAGGRLRPGAAEMARSVLAYLHTRPVLSIFERVPGRPSNDKSKRPVTTTREKERRFYLVPELLAAPGAINFRVIGDDYFAVVPPGTDPASSELRRAYLQFVFDPLVLRFNREVAARRAEIRTLLDEERARTKSDVTPDVFLAVARSLVAAADARMTEAARVGALTGQTRARLAAAKSDAERAALTKQLQEERAAAEDATAAQLADAYERGAVLAFFFAEQLRGLESSGFDVAAFLPDMLSSFQLPRERGRPAEYAAARQRHLERRKALAARAAETGAADPASEDPRRAALIKSLEEVNELLRQKNHAEAERRLRALSSEFPGEPRIFFALAQAASLSAEQAFDADLQAQRLRLALGHYRMAVERASADTDRALLCRSHAAMGRILAFLERNDEAAGSFDAALQSCEAGTPAYRDALAGKRALGKQ